MTVLRDVRLGLGVTVLRDVRLGLGVTVLAGLGLLLAGGVDPVHHMLSDAVHAMPGAVLLPVAIGGLAAAGAWLIAGARRVLARPGPVTALLTVWCASLVALAVFPTNAPGVEPGAAALVHRFAAGVMAALPPLLALLIARLAEGLAPPVRIRRLRVAGWLTLAACLTFAVGHGPAALGGQGLLPFVGLAERVLLALVVAVVWLCAWVLDAVPQPAIRSAEAVAVPLSTVGR